MMARRSSLLALLWTIVLVWPVNAAAADNAITRDRTATNVSAFSGKLLWSREVEDGARLVLGRRSGQLRDLPVRLRSGVFDADLGRNRQGSEVAVYTSCAGLGGGDCDVRQFNLERNRASRVRGASTDRCSEFAPSIWAGAVVFGRRGPRGCSGLYIKRPLGSTRRLDPRVPADTDMRKDQVAYLHTPSASRSFIRMRSTSGTQSRLIVAGVAAEGERSRVTNPTFAGSYLYWLQEDLRRRDFLAGRTTGGHSVLLQFSDRTFPGRVDSIAVDGRRVFYTNGRGLFEATDPVPQFAFRE